MMKIFCIFGVFLLFVLLILPGNNTSYAENTELQTTETAIKILDNGLKIICIEDHSSPLVSVVTAVKVGSADEEWGEKGLSHFLEHLLFKGTESRSYKEINETLEAIGGYNNAFTRQDYTSFEIVVPSNYTRLGLEIQADMLFHSTIPAEELEKERGVVTVEINHSLDNPYLYLADFFQRNFYQGTNYAHPIMGYSDIISTISRENIYDFYKRYYVPNNMTLVAVGDFKTRDFIKAVKEIFGTVSPKELEKKRGQESKVGIKGKDSIIEETNFKVSLMDVGFPLPDYKSEDAYALEMLCNVLILGEDSRLNSKLKREQGLVSYINGGYGANQESGILKIMAMLDERDLLLVVESILKEIEILKTELVTNEELHKIKVNVEVGQVFQKEKFLHRAREIAGWDITVGYAYMKDYLDHLLQVTPEDIQKVAQKYFDDPNYLVAAIKPSAKTTAKREITLSSMPKKKVLPNGLTIIALEQSGLPITTLTVIIKGGMSYEPIGKDGVAHFLSKMLKKGTTNRTEKEITNQLAQIGASIETTDNPFISMDDFYNSLDYSFIHYQTIDKYFEKGLDILTDIIRNPIFPQESIQKVREEILSLIYKKNSSPSYEAYQSFLKTLFPLYPYGKPRIGSEKTINLIEREDILDYYKNYYAPNNMIISIVSNHPALEMIEKVEKSFSDMTKVELNIPDLHLSSADTSMKKIVEEKISIQQAYLSLGYIVFNVDKNNLASLVVMNEVLGGGATNRLNTSIREEAGLVYSIGSSFALNKEAHWFRVGFATNTEKIEETLDSLFKEFAKLKSELITEKELTKVKNGLIGRRSRYRQRRINKSHFLASYESRGFGYEFDDKFTKMIEDITVEDVQKAAQKYLRSDNYILSIVKPK